MCVRDRLISKLRNRRGEALPTTIQTSCASELECAKADPVLADLHQGGWHVLWTRSNCEQLVHDQLATRGYELFLPTVDKWSRRRHARCLYRAPLFPGYLFIRHAVDPESYLEIAKARGLVRMLGSRWDNLAVVPERDIAMITQIHKSDIPRMPHPYLKKGQMVRIISGPLTNVEGVLLETEPRKGLLVLSLELLQRSIAVTVDCTAVTVI